ncbi:UPF0481 protein At3g47200-like [Neltuma alba]|uniref:UPF0481 protein At3g47200-like n=1 Tax=Neltuma alba TaxID=207710 RepID=UPI0010A562FC|nr:UPF0481 protein At3g47200-like [Prosopis alba]
MASSDCSCSSYERGATPSDLPQKLKSSLDELEEKRRTLEREDRQILKPIPKIQKVQPYLRKRDDLGRYYRPKVVSFGPIHHGEDDLQGGERCKKTWAAMYLKDIKRSAGSLFKEIRSRLQELKELYTEDAIEGFLDKEEKLAWIFLLDACALLGFLQKVNTERPDENLRIKEDQLVLVQQDVLLLENQLPYPLLRLLSNARERELDNWIKQFLSRYQRERITGQGAPTETTWNPPPQVEITVEQPPHLLHLLRKFILVDPDCDDRKPADPAKRGSQKFPTYRNIQELEAAGISVAKGDGKKLTDIRFDWGMTRRGFGRLWLNKLIVDVLTLPTFLNLIAYEMCPDFMNGYGISSYVAFLDSLIDHPEDVKHLRKAGVLHNVLGSDEDVAKLFNIISSDLMPGTAYREVGRDLETRYNQKYFTWLAQALHDHFSSPWALLGFVAASIALFLTFVQTWLAMHPPPPNA